jgi:outer membrane protein OmpA-like peptidoglycan-associated protein
MPRAEAAGCEADGVSPHAPRLVTVERTDEGVEESEAMSVTGDETMNDLQWTVAWPRAATGPLPAVDRPEVGGVVRMFRCLPPGRWALVGEGRVRQLNGSLVEATVRMGSDRTETSTGGHHPRSLALRGNLFPRPMAGDAVVPVRTEVVARPRIDPRVELDARVLFDADEALTDEGRERLREEISKFARSRGRLLVEAHIAVTGDRLALRRASQLRADAVAQFAAREFGIPSDHIVALGFGSDAMASAFEDVAAWPLKRADESIVLRALPSGPR